MKKVIAAIACILLGPFFAWSGLSDLITAARANSWPTAEGTIETSSVTEGRADRKGRRLFTPEIRYSFEVSGTTYTGDRVDNGDRGKRSPEDALAIAMHYREGQTVRVHYNAKDPKQALLETGTTSDNWLVFGMGLLMTGVGVWIGRSLWQELQSNQYTSGSGL